VCNCVRDAAHRLAESVLAVTRASLMPQARCAHLDVVSQKWRLLAERRVTDLVDLYKSGHWSRYFSAETFLRHMEQAVASSARWAEIAPRPSPEMEQEYRDVA
jgi:hypothetical protein